MWWSYLTIPHQQNIVINIGYVIAQICWRQHIANGTDNNPFLDFQLIFWFSLNNFQLFSPCYLYHCHLWPELNNMLYGKTEEEYKWNALYWDTGTNFIFYVLSAPPVSVFWFTGQIRIIHDWKIVKCDFLLDSATYKNG